MGQVFSWTAFQTLTVASPGVRLTLGNILFLYTQGDDYEG